ncbi:MAG TPA: hypothetical protein VHS29_11370, partial [Candidatus Acidoferrales bacterium]|nr:hypothetical protein [Candidatus Acidoferrales bacterium]
KNWQRKMWFRDTGLRWINPSPNLRSEEAGILYPGLEILQAGGVSVGRGTGTPFEIVGAPWIRAEDFAAYLNRRAIPGVRFEARRFTPDAGLFKGELCEGIHVVLGDRNVLQSMRMGIEIAAALSKLYPGKFESMKMIVLVGNSKTIKQIQDGRDPVGIVASWDASLELFRKMHAKYLLYP